MKLPFVESETNMCAVAPNIRKRISHLDRWFTALLKCRRVSNSDRLQLARVDMHAILQMISDTLRGMMHCMNHSRGDLLRIPHRQHVEGDDS
jgi:hypothetical protein